MKKLLANFMLVASTIVTAQVYPPDKQLVFDAMPTVSKPAYLSPITDPTFNTKVVRIGDQTVFDSKTSSLEPRHHYSKNQPWNSDGTKIMLHGWPAPILDGSTFQYIKYVNPPGGHHTWSNTQPNIIYGANNGNSLLKLDVNTNTTTTIKTFSEYTFISYGSWEGNMSNDDKYIALQCSTSSAKTIVCYDIQNNTIVSTMNAPVWPNNVAMSQSGKYVMVQWDVEGTANYQGICAYNRSDMSFVRNIASSGGGHFDYGYDINGNEVIVGHNSKAGHPLARGLCMIRIDNGTTTLLISDANMSYPIHVSCRNLNRPGWAYISEFQADGTRPDVANYQKVFAVKLDPSANNNAVTETFAHVHHSFTIDYERETHAVPNRNGSVVMWKSDWMIGDGEIDSYVAYMPQTDTQKPSTPTNLNTTTIAQTSLTLSWTAATDNVGVTGYEVFQGSTSKGTTTSTSLNISGLTCNTSYSYTVKARDAAGNWSDASLPKSVTTSACSTTVAVTGVTLSSTTATVATGATTTLTATVVPSNATNKSVTWSTSNSGVATVSTSGVVTGVAAGTATITVTTADGGKTATCAVTVTSTQNLGFENNFIGWTTYGTASINTANYHSGTKSGYFANGGGNYVYSGLTPGATYTVKGWVKAVSGTDIWITVNNFGGTQVGKQLTSTSWTQSGDIVFTMGATNTSATLSAWTGATSSAYFDDYTIVATTPTNGKLTGTVIGTTGSWNNSGNTRDKVFDGNTASFFDAPGANGNWVGLDMGATKQITSIKYYPRQSFESRMNGGIFQASNTADFSSGVVNLITISTNPPLAWSTATVSNTNGYRYVRYLSPADGYGNVAEVEFYGIAKSTVEAEAATNISNISNNQTIIYPNPVSDVLNIKLNTEVSNALVNVFDMQGRSIILQTINAQTESINMGNLNAGIYFVRVTNGMQTINTKIVKK